MDSLKTSCHFSCTWNILGMVKKEPSPRNTSPPKIMMRTVATTLTKAMASALPRFSMCSVKMGMKAALRAPSPKRRRNKLGILNATVNASQTIPVPKILAHIISLARPRIRLKNVQTLIILTERNRLCDSDIATQ